jgi:hypothetical protein
MYIEKIKKKMENLIKANYRKGKMIKKGTENLTKKINK